MIYYEKIFTYEECKTIIDKKIGNTCLFDALSPHMVDEVIEGSRFSLITHIRNS